MSKKYWIVGSLVGLLMIVGVGCASKSNNKGQPTERKQKATEQKSSKLINPIGNINVILSASDKQEIILDAKNIAISVFDSGIRLQGLMNTDIIAKGSIGIGYSTPEPAQANQLDAMVNAFQTAGYSIIQKHPPVATDPNDKSGGVIAEKNSKVLVLTFEPGQKQISFSAMTKDQYTYLMNTEENENNNTKQQ